MPSHQSTRKPLRHGIRVRSASTQHPNMQMATRLDSDTSPRSRFDSGKLENDDSSSVRGRRMILSQLDEDVLSTVFLFLDKHDIAPTAATCRSFNKTMKHVDQRLWLGLVRKYHPDVEELTNILFSSSFIPQQMRTSLKSSQKSSCPIPPPSTNWKMQFKRKHMFMKQIVPGYKLPSSHMSSLRPLSCYLFQIELTCKRCKRHVCPPPLQQQQPLTLQQKVGRFTCILNGGGDDDDDDPSHTILDPAMDWTMSSLKFNVSEILRQQLAELHCGGIDYFDMTIHVIDKASGRQALLYQGAPDFVENFNHCMYDTFEYPHASNGCLSYADVASTRCACFCDGHDDLPSFFGRRGCCDLLCERNKQISRCCSCEKEWDCFHGYNIYLRMYDNIEFDEMDYDNFLRFLENGLLYA